MEKKHGDAEIAEGTKASGRGFEWEYLAGSNLKSQLTYPNDAVVTWSYEPHRDLLTAVTNATYSTYVYTNDLLGRRTSKNDEQYGYNARDELISANDTFYAYDDIGNRTTAEGKTYTVNNLNQYTAIDDFVPQYDDDGNQTLIKTETGIWSVLYNAENRPIRWQSGDTVITMAFDRMGRRVEMRTVKDGAETLQRFVYDNYLCVQQLRGADNALFHSYVWDPTEPIATRPLVFLPTSGENAYYFHDGNKNVSDLVSFSASPIHYDYTPFGSLFASAPFGSPFGFSSEMYDEVLNLIYYNHRHYNLNDGRWLGRDSMEEDGGINLFSFLANNPLSNIDHLGEAFFALRPLENIPWLGPPSNNPLDDYFNTEIAHEQLFFEDGKEPSSIGFFADNGGSLKSEPFTDKYRVTKTGFNDCVMRKALEYVDLPPYSLLGWGEKQKFNCQDFAETLREIYNILIQSECIRDCCGL